MPAQNMGLMSMTGVGVVQKLGKLRDFQKQLLPGWVLPVSAISKLRTPAEKPANNEK